ncbi:MAG: hypothetical protein JSR73_08775 [Proteobacteria bacterium]|nr:hypothetical protein [Pseudomonadota bacterium]
MIGVASAALAGAAVIVAELVVVAIRRDRGWPGLAANAVAGLLLMAATGLASQGRDGGALLCLALAGIAHVADVAHRLAGRTR